MIDTTTRIEALVAGWSRIPIENVAEGGERQIVVGKSYDMLHLNYPLVRNSAYILCLVKS